MMIEVQLFAGLREVWGGESVTIKFCDDATVADVLVAVEQLLPECESLVRLSRVAIDQQFASTDTPLAGCREVALIPPVSGG